MTAQAAGVRRRMKGPKSHNLLAFLLLALCMLPVAAHGPVDYAELYKEVSKSVVDIHKVFEVGSDVKQAFQSISYGTGIIVSSEGHILTNAHVIYDEGAEKDRASILIVLNDGQKIDAEVVSYDLHSDIALLKIDVNQDLPVARIGDSDNLEVGGAALAIGHPGILNDYSYDYSLTSGVISYLNRWLPAPNDVAVECSVPFIQTDAAINGGNSGGPLLNGRGEVIGINTSADDKFIGIYFAVPINLAMDLQRQMQDTGKIRWGMLGVYLEPEASFASHKRGVIKGFAVNKVREGSGADAAGVETGDIIVEYNHIKVKDLYDFPCLMAGKKVPIKVIREGQELDLTVTLGAIEDDGRVAAIN